MGWNELIPKLIPIPKQISSILHFGDTRQKPLRYKRPVIIKELPKIFNLEGIWYIEKNATYKFSNEYFFLKIWHKEKVHAMGQFQ